LENVERSCKNLINNIAMGFPLYHSFDGGKPYYINVLFVFLKSCCVINSSFEKSMQQKETTVVSDNKYSVNYSCSRPIEMSGPCPLEISGFSHYEYSKCHVRRMSWIRMSARDLSGSIVSPRVKSLPTRKLRFSIATVIDSAEFRLQQTRSLQYGS
jgi:hypothetical protein